MKHKLLSLLLSLTLLSSTTSASAERYCYHNDWLYLAGGTVLGAAAGALTGYFAGHHRKGPRGKRGEQGPQGEQGPPGIVVMSNFAEEISILATNLVAPDNRVQFTYELRDPIGTVLIDEPGMGEGTMMPSHTVQAEDHKLTGVYTVVITITAPTTIPTRLVEPLLNGVQFSPAIPEKTWEVGERSILTAVFSPTA